MNSRVIPSRPAVDPTCFLRKTLLADAVFAGVSGVVFLVAPGPIASLVGLSSALTVAGVGFVLIAYAAGLVRSARQKRVTRADALAPIALNLAWVAGTAFVVAAGALSRQANWALLMVADGVLLFAVLEGVGLRRIATS